MTQFLAQPRTSNPAVSARALANGCIWHGDVVETMHAIGTGFKPYDQRPKETPL